MKRRWIIRGDDDQARCWWCSSAPEYGNYHDTEWGFPVDDDTRLFEKLCLEGFQAGLSWLTILRKRKNFRAGFKGFDIPTVARFTQRDVNRLLEDTGIVRHRGKIESTINNAQRAIELQAEFGSLAAYVWGFEPTRSRTHRSGATIPAKTDQSASLSGDLRQRGWSFVGPTTVYAFMQAMGMVNDHLGGCHIHNLAADAREKFQRPS